MVKANASRTFTPPTDRRPVLDCNGVEVKNTFDYMPNAELDAKLAMCQHLGLRPLFIVRNRDHNQLEKVRAGGGEIYMFKSKVLPPGFEDLAGRVLA